MHLRLILLASITFFICTFFMHRLFLVSPLMKMQHFSFMCVIYNLKKVFWRCMKNINHHPSSTIYPSLGLLVVNMYNLDAAVKQSDVHIIRAIDLVYMKDQKTCSFLIDQIPLWISMNVGWKRSCIIIVCDI